MPEAFHVVADGHHDMNGLRLVLFVSGELFLNELVYIQWKK